MVYVPAGSKTIATWNSLRKKLENEQALNGCMWYPHTYTANAWSRDGVGVYARNLDASIRSKVIEAGKNTSRPISRITLMGHSLGGVLARIAYLISAGQYKENSQGSEWWKKVDRIVLFAAPNRGIESKRFTWLERLAIYSPFGRLGQIAHDQLSGSEAITNLRIRWIRFFAELDSSARPAVVQLLGKGDRLVSRDDSLDVEQFSQAWQYDVPGATHEDLHIVPDDDNGRYNILREAILGPKPPDLQANDQTGMKKHPVVIVLHGIRANNEDWAAQISDGIESCAPNALAIPPTYRYFSMLEFAIPWLRAKKIRWFQDQYSNLLARYPRARFSFIGHSNGTYMLGHSLERVPGMVFDRVTLIGSVLPREYEWDKRFALGQVEQVTNHRSSFDVPVAILCNLLRALGMRDVGTAGFDGFDQRRPEIKEVYYYNGGHGKPLEKENLKHLIEYTLSGKADYPNAQKDRAPGKLLSRLSGSAVVGLAVAGALVVAFGLAIWLLASLLGSLLPLPPVVVWLFAALFVGVTSYLFSRYY